MREAMPLPQSMQSQLAQAKMDRTVQAATQLAALPPMLELRDGVLGAVETASHWTTAPGCAHHRNQTRE